MCGEVQWQAVVRLGVPRAFQSRSGEGWNISMFARAAFRAVGGMWALDHVGSTVAPLGCVLTCAIKRSSTAVDVDLRALSASFRR